MIEYIFFDVSLRNKFVSYAMQHEVPCTAVDDNMGMVVEIPEDIPEEMSDRMEEFYEALEDEQASLSKAEGEMNSLAGFRFNLPTGESRMLPLPTAMANRLLVSFTLEELQELFETVARCTLDPNDEHLCHILAEQKKNQ
jgi:hypothetical protein